MGVKGLYTYLRPYRHPVYVATLPPQPLRIGIDAMSMLYTYKSSFPELYPMLKALLAQGHRLLFVFDGKPPAEKEEEVATRREARADAAAQAAALKEHLAAAAPTSEKERQILQYSVARLEHQGWHMTREIRHEFQRALWDLGIPYVKALGEADDVLTDLVAAEKLDVVVSTDMDYLLSSVPRLWIPCRRGAAGFEEILLWEVLEGEGMAPAALTDAGILCGVEPLRGRVSVPSQTAFSWMRYYGSIEALLASSVQDTQLDPLRTPETLAAARAHFAARAPWSARMRPDHMERFKEFLEAL